MFSFLNWRPGKLKHSLICLISGIIVSGCATYGNGINKSLNSMEQGDYKKAEEEIKKSLSPKGCDRLLYHMELGTIKRLDKNYLESNSSFETAERISEELYTKNSKEIFTSLFINSRKTAYSGKDFEKVFLNYFKALNYLGLNSRSKYNDFQESIVELKRLNFKLNSYEFEKGSYKDVKSSENEKFTILLKIFRAFQGKIIDYNWLKYREDAYFRYFSGVIYELAGEYDSARIDYEKAAGLYERGYIKQYDLDGELAEQAWFDTIRMMIKSGGYENWWPDLAKEKLSRNKFIELNKLNNKNGEIIVIQHLGKIPQRKELNLHLSAKKGLSSFSIRPVPVGTNQEINDQLAWFGFFYGDKNFVSLIRSYSSDNLYEFLDGIGTKTIWLGPFWEKIEKIGLAEAVGEDGVRITIPYYPPIRSLYGNSEVKIGKKRKTLLRGESLGSIAIQSQLLNTGKDLNIELARSSLKLLLAHEAGEKIAGGSAKDFFSIAGKIAASASSAAETRNWLSLPLEIRINRISVPPGEHEVKLITMDKNNMVLSEETEKIKVNPGESKIWIKRTF